MEMDHFNGATTWSVYKINGSKHALKHAQILLKISSKRTAVCVNVKKYIGLSIHKQWFSDHRILLLRLRVCVKQRLSAIKEILLRISSQGKISRVWLLYLRLLILEMAAIVRVKRSRNENPANTIVVSCKKAKLDHRAVSDKQNDLRGVFKFAATLDVKASWRNFER